MAIEEPYVGESGEVGYGWRFTDQDRAEIGMAYEMWFASPDGRAQYERIHAALPDATWTFGE